MMPVPEPVAAAAVAIVPSDTMFSMVPISKGSQAEERALDS